jgi:hypothetical protein
MTIEAARHKGKQKTEFVGGALGYPGELLAPRTRAGAVLFVQGK